jgi:hypothetical protein
MADSIPQDTPDFSKRYWLFWWYAYEAGGGMNDFAHSFDDTESAVNFHQADEFGHDRGHVFDSHSKKDAAILHVSKGWVYFE